ncbi:MAG: hypothetical protein COB20_00040 [SAR86 cluster bacterium]|uniref:Quinohemoprotein amine dehydrogenase alpha subunit haem binding domain-containing protein n=1 Tax=SAR86 cluster bacterium TaxID=2030880 RepID=A0A2A4XK18_9GAMM|nr:MAG: hypothetical protein COB20_00040 [SAR86 cluster bacterium]
MFTTAGSAAQESTASGELIQEEGWQLVRDNCTECHSSQIIVQNSGSREVWKSRIEWMQDSQGLGELGAELEGSILDYLATNYGQKTASRRQALPAHLMPPNPNL